TLFPYTTLFRSVYGRRHDVSEEEAARMAVGIVLGPAVHRRGERNIAGDQMRAGRYQHARIRVAAGANGRERTRDRHAINLDAANESAERNEVDVVGREIIGRRA